MYKQFLVGLIFISFTKMQASDNSAAMEDVFERFHAEFEAEFGTDEEIKARIKALEEEHDEARRALADNRKKRQDFIAEGDRITAHNKQFREATKAAVAKQREDRKSSEVAGKSSFSLLPKIVIMAGTAGAVGYAAYRFYKKIKA